jgi:hypothetical protein
MHNNEERFTVTAGLACLCTVGAVTAVVPVVGYVLLGAVILGVVAVIAMSVVLWWDTRFQPESLPHRASEDAARRARTPQHAIEREVA